MSNRSSFVVIVLDPDIGYVSVRPVERDAPLAIDADTIAQWVMILQLLKLVAARNPQIIKVFGAIDLPQFAPRDVLNVRRQLAAALAIPDAFGFGVSERADHIRDHSPTAYAKTILATLFASEWLKSNGRFVISMVTLGRIAIGTL